MPLHNTCPKSIQGDLEQGRVTMPPSLIVYDRDCVVDGLRSLDGRFRFMLQPDCSLVLHKEEDAIWAIYVLPQSDGLQQDLARLVLDKTGNLMIVDELYGVMWESDTGNIVPGPFTLFMQNDGDCVLSGAGGIYLWSTRTAGWG